MHCPSCGHENNDLATRCSACGSVLPESPSQDTTAQLHTSQPTQATQGTEEKPIPRNPPKANKALIKRSPSWRDRFGDFFRSHQKAVGVGIALLVVALVGGAWLLLSMTNKPSYKQIEDDLAQLMSTYAYSGGTYGPDLDIPLSKVTVTKREATTVPENLGDVDSVGTTAYNVEAEATFDDDAVRAVRNVGITYVLAKDGWTTTGEPTEHGVSLTALTGVSEDKVLENMGAVLAEAATPGDTSLTEVYGDGEFSVTNSDFEATPQDDTATDDMVIHCQKTENFCAYAGDITAHFAFESGKWRLRKAEASSDATLRSFEPLVGTWYGDLTDDSSMGGSCFGAQGELMAVRIESVGDSTLGKGQVKGTISCTAHYHKRLEKDQQSTEGDEMVEEFPFAGTITTNYESQTGSSLNVECTTSGSARGELEFVLSFGTDDDPSTAIARVTSTHTYEEMTFIFVPTKTTARFTDTYILTKE